MKGVPNNPEGAIAIKNIPPIGWSGRSYNTGIYKGGNLLVTQLDLDLNAQADFIIEPKLFFGVVRSMQVGDIFSSLDAITSLTMFDLTRYPNGINVTLTQAPGSGTYEFSAEAPHVN